MEPLHIKATPTSLDVLLDAQTGMFSFFGRSVSEHSIEFFSPVITWLEKYAETPAERTECIFRLEYFNSAARKSLIGIFTVLHSIHKKGSPVLIVWHYEEGDDSIKELGEEYASMYNLKFQFPPTS